MRGKRLEGFRLDSSRRLIPACAGKTVVRVIVNAVNPAHPRVCGENKAYLDQSRIKAGSSPRVRGKLQSEIRGNPLRWLIPACAGKTHRPIPRRSLGGAHPRVCGENVPRGAEDTAPPGSSPRVRGKRI